MRYIFILNPLAGSGGQEQIIRNALDDLPEKESCEVYLTQSVGDATRYVKNRCATPHDEELRFIACGGDGTINEVFTGAMGAENVSVTCYPCGSGNDFVKAFGGAELFLNIPALLNAENQKIDVLKVGDRYSFNVTNFGFDTTVASTVSDYRAKKGHGGKSAYTLGIVKALITSMKNCFTVTADGEVLNPSGYALLCTVANGEYVGGSFRCAPRASTNDGLMEVCIAKPIGRIAFAQLLGVYTAGQHLDDPKYKDIFTYRQAKLVEVDAPEGFAYSLDGEIIHENHFTIEILPTALTLAVPK